MVPAFTDVLFPSWLSRASPSDFAVSAVVRGHKAKKRRLRHGEHISTFFTHYFCQHCANSYGHRTEFRVVAFELNWPMSYPAENTNEAAYHLCRVFEKGAAKMQARQRCSSIASAKVIRSRVRLKGRRYLHVVTLFKLVIEIGPASLADTAVNGRFTMMTSSLRHREARWQSLSARGHVVTSAYVADLVSRFVFGQFVWCF